MARLERRQQSCAQRGARDAHTRHHLWQTAGERAVQGAGGGQMRHSRRPEFDQKQLRAAPVVLGAPDVHERVLVQPREVDALAEQRARPPRAHERRRALFELLLEQIPGRQLLVGAERLEDAGLVPPFEFACGEEEQRSALRTRHSGRGARLLSAVFHLAKQVWR